MSHRVIIAESMRVILGHPEVRRQLNERQCARVDEICSKQEPSDEEFRYLTRQINRAYCGDD